MAHCYPWDGGGALKNGQRHTAPASRGAAAVLAVVAVSSRIRWGGRSLRRPRDGPFSRRRRPRWRQQRLDVWLQGGVESTRTSETYLGYRGFAWCSRGRLLRCAGTTEPHGVFSPTSCAGACIELGEEAVGIDDEGHTRAAV